MPLYNKKPYVRRAVDSVLNQRFEDFELIIIDDGSTDGSVAEVPLNEPRIKLIRQKNAGPSAARNRGLDAANGRFVTFIDADDYYYVNKLEKNAHLLGHHPGVEWLISAFNFITDDQSSYRSIKDSKGNSINGGAVVFNNALLNLDISGIPINGLCVNKTIICQALNGFRSSLRCFEITELLVRCALVCPRVIVDPEPLFTVFDVPDSTFKVSADRTQAARHMSQLYQIISSDLQRSSNLYDIKAMRMCLSHARGLIQSNQKKKAKQYLLHSFPYKKNRQWFKLYLHCLMPSWLLSNSKFSLKN